MSCLRMLSHFSVLVQDRFKSHLLQVFVLLVGIYVGIRSSVYCARLFDNLVMGVVKCFKYVKELFRLTFIYVTIQ